MICLYISILIILQILKMLAYTFIKLQAGRPKFNNVMKYSFYDAIAAILSNNCISKVTGYCSHEEISL